MQTNAHSPSLSNGLLLPQTYTISADTRTHKHFHMRENACVQTLSGSACGLGKESALAMLDLVRKNRYLTQLDVSGTQLTYV